MTDKNVDDGGTLHKTVFKADDVDGADNKALAACGSKDKAEHGVCDDIADDADGDKFGGADADAKNKDGAKQSGSTEEGGAAKDNDAAGNGGGDDNDSYQAKLKEIKKIKRNADKMRLQVKADRFKRESSMYFYNYIKAAEKRRKKAVLSKNKTYLEMCRRGDESLYWLRSAEKKALRLKHARNELKHLRAANKTKNVIIREYRRVIRRQKSLMLGKRHDDGDSSETQSDSDMESENCDLPVPVQVEIVFTDTELNDDEYDEVIVLDTSE